jgi:hypothetical protein
MNSGRCLACWEALLHRQWRPHIATTPDTLPPPAALLPSRSGSSSRPSHAACSPAARHGDRCRGRKAICTHVCQCRPCTPWQPAARAGAQQEQAAACVPVKVRRLRGKKGTLPAALSGLLGSRTCGIDPFVSAPPKWLSTAAKAARASSRGLCDHTNAVLRSQPGLSGTTQPNACHQTACLQCSSMPACYATCCSSCCTEPCSSCTALCSCASTPRSDSCRTRGPRQEASAICAPTCWSCACLEWKPRR